MPVYARTRVTAGTFHNFHNALMTELRNALNGGVIPARYYALGKQHAGDVSPDVLTLHAEYLPTSPVPSAFLQGTPGALPSPSCDAWQH